MVQRLRARGDILLRGVFAAGPLEFSHAHERLLELLHTPTGDRARTVQDALAIARACADAGVCIDAFIAFRMAYLADPANSDVHACYWHIRSSFPAGCLADFDRTHEMLTDGVSTSARALPRSTNVQSLLPRLPRRP